MALVVALLATLASCGQGGTPTPTPEHTTHNFGEWSATKNATCTEDGVKTRYCSCGEKQSDTIPATDHNKQVIPAVESTCTENGLTEGVKCLDCGEVFVAQQETPLKAHTEQIIPGVESTCTSTGLTEGKKCSVCDTIIVAQQTIPEIAHTYDDKYDETCNKCGFVRDAECAHRETETLKGYAATCTSAGLTDGTKCKKCGEILVAQTIIPVIDHSFGDWLTVKNPTVTEQGTKERYCACGAKETDSIPMLKASEGLEFTSNGDGTCYVSGIGTCRDTDVVIPSTHNGLLVTSIGNGAFDYCSRLTSVVIPDSVTSIGQYAFSGCSSLESVVIPDSVTSIDSTAFYDCDSLTGIKVDSNNSNYKDIDGNLYTKDGKTLIQYAIGKSDTHFVIPNGVTSIGYKAFYGCDSLTSIVIPDSVTSIGDYAFYDCSSLESVVIGDSVTSIGDQAFFDCTSLTSVTIPDSVTSIGDGAFLLCASLTNIKVDSNNEYYKDINGNLYTKNGKILIQYAMGKSDTSFTIPDSVTSIGSNAFCDCTGLTSIVIPDSVTSIGVQAFCDCDNLVSVVIPDSVTSIGEGAFYYCSSLTSITISDSVTSIGKSVFSHCSSLESVVIPDSVTWIANQAFASCSSLTSVVIPDSVTSIDSYAFYGCSSLRSIKYRGTQSQWNAISKGSFWNYNTGNYTITYNYKGE